MNNIITKTRFVEFMTCRRMAWLAANTPWLRTLSDTSKQLAEAGNVVGELAKGLFAPSVDALVLKEDGSLDVDAMALSTMEYIVRGEETIFDAAFCTFNGKRLAGICVSDILHKENGGYAVYEVKSSCIPDSKKYIWDLAYQDHVLSRKGIVPVAFYSVVLNRDYVWDGKTDSNGSPVYDLSRLFLITDLTDEVVKYRGMLDNAESDVSNAIREDAEPWAVLCNSCMNCDFFGRCELQLCLEEKYGYALEPTIDKAALCTFIDSLGENGTCFLDFETKQSPLPTVAGTRPYQPIPRMYTCYIDSDAFGDRNKEYSSDENDPFVVRHFAENLVRDVPAGHAVVVYGGAAAKRTCLLMAASMYPDLADRLRQIAGSIIDLQTVFKRGWYYDRTMHADFSLKSVFMALFPFCSHIDYYYDTVDAMLNVFRKIKDVSGWAEIRNAMTADLPFDPDSFFSNIDFNS